MVFLCACGRTILNERYSCVHLTLTVHLSISSHGTTVHYQLAVMAQLYMYQLGAIPQLIFIN